VPSSERRKQIAHGNLAICSEFAPEFTLKFTQDRKIMLQTSSPTRLRHCTLVDDPEGTTTKLVVGQDTFDLARDGDRDKFLTLKSLLDGRHTKAEISQLSGVNEESVQQVIDVFKDTGLFQARSEQNQIPVEEFIAQVEASCMMWRRQIDLHRLFGGLLEATFRKEVFLGLMIETYHYVRILPATLLAIADDITDKQLRSVIQEYANEERDHYKVYEPILAKIPRIGKWILTSHPCPGTLAVVRNFESIGRRDGLSLACCLQLIEARASETRSAEHQLRSIADHYDLGELVVPYLHHMNADIELGHSGLLQDAMAHIESVDMQAAHDAVNDMHDTKHSFDIFHDSIVAYYADISNYIPRPKVDYFAL